MKDERPSKLERSIGSEVSNNEDKEKILQDKKTGLLVGAILGATTLSLDLITFPLYTNAGFRPIPLFSLMNAAAVGLDRLCVKHTAMKYISFSNWIFPKNIYKKINYF